MTYIDQDLTTQVFYRTTFTSEDDTVFLHYVFCSFGPCIDGFKYCKPVISIDGTHLYDKYQGKLLVAMATDANNKVFPLAFAIVDCESGSSWRWFLQYLRDTIGHVILDEGICIISVSKTPLQTGLEGMMEEHEYFIDIAFDMLLAISTHIFRTRL